MTHWYCREFLVPPELEDAFTAALWDHGIQGCELRPPAAAGESPPRMRVVAYFPTPEAGDRLELGVFPGVELAAEGEVEERDWLAEYRAAARPLDIGPYRIDPRDPDGEAAPGAEGQILLRIPAQSAFGTGSHETTRLALGWVGELDLEGQRILDVGTGSGILALAALARGARSAVGFDVDAGVLPIARHNGSLNRQVLGPLRPRLFAGTLAAVGGAARFDLVLVNVLPERIVADLPRLPAMLAPGGRLLSSGNLESRREELLARFAELGLRPVGERREGEWAAFLLGRTDDPAV